MNDIATITGGTVVSEEVGLTLEKAEVSVLGRCKNVTITKDDTILMNGFGDKQLLEERVQVIQDQIENTTSEYDREKLQERLAKLKGGVGIIKVGGASEVEVGEIKDRITDALNATKAAVDEGIVVGGGCALLYASKALESLKGANFDQDIGIEIVKKVKIIKRLYKSPARRLWRTPAARARLWSARFWSKITRFSALTPTKASTAI